jgi:hydrogenase nickel incorporation protein HypA/HybF
MHEWALAEAVVATAVKAAKEQDLKDVTDIKINLGQLQQIEKDIFEFAIKEAFRPHQELFKKTEVRIQEEEALFKCRACNREWAFDDIRDDLDSTKSESIHFVPEVVHAYRSCPECRSPDFDVVRGRGVWIDSISGERGE